MEQKAFAQGFGETEDGTLPDEVLEAEVMIISNSKCEKWTNFNKTQSNEIEAAINRNLPQGITDDILCTIGILDEETGVYSVSISYKSLICRSTSLYNKY